MPLVLLVVTVVGVGEGVGAGVGMGLGAGDCDDEAGVVVNLGSAPVPRTQASGGVQVETGFPN